MTDKSTPEPVSDDAPAKYLTPRELLDGGYVQEANRLFFHPLGLALAAVLDDDPDAPGQLLVLDDREDPAGCWFGGSLPGREKADLIAHEHINRRQRREAILGFWVQPLPVDAADQIDRMGQLIQDHGTPNVAAYTPAGDGSGVGVLTIGWDDHDPAMLHGITPAQWQSFARMFDFDAS